MGTVLLCAIAAPDVVTTMNAINMGIDAIASPVMYRQPVQRERRKLWEFAGTPYGVHGNTAANPSYDRK